MKIQVFKVGGNWKILNSIKKTNTTSTAASVVLNLRHIDPFKREIFEKKWIVYHFLWI